MCLLSIYRSHHLSYLHLFLLSSLLMHRLFPLTGIDNESPFQTSMKGLHNNNNVNIGDLCKECPRFLYFWLLKNNKKEKIFKIIFH